MKKVVITGGCGFIGSNLIRWIKAFRPDWHVINIDKLTYAASKNNLNGVDTSNNYTLVDRDITHRFIVSETITSDVDCVFNLAAETHVDRSIDQSHDFIKSNVVGTQVLLDVCRKNGVKRFVQISTDEVYGSADSGQFYETTPLAPSNPYAASKAAADLLVQSFHKTYGMDVIITRCSNNYGPFQHVEKAIPCFIYNILQNKSVPIYGDGLQIRDWIYVSDHCRGIIAAAERGKTGEIYNFGGGCNLNNIQLVNMLATLLNRPDATIEFVEDRPGHDRRYSMNFDKAAKELKWEPMVKFQVGLDQTVLWYRELWDR